MELLHYLFTHPEKKELRREYFKKDFLAYCWYYFPYEFHHETADFQEEYCYEMWKGMDIYFEGFRESAKTTFYRMYVSWCIAYKKKRYIMHYNSVESQAKTMLLDIIVILQTNKRFISDF